MCIHNDYYNYSSKDATHDAVLFVIPADYFLPVHCISPILWLVYYYNTCIHKYLHTYVCSDFLDKKLSGNKSRFPKYRWAST